MTHPEISLVIIAYDEEINIGRCIDSFQGAFDELIVHVDSRTKDRTAEIAASKGAKVSTFVWEDNFSKARNDVMREATGRWTMWADCDDVLEPGGARRIREAVEKYDGESRVNCITTPYVLSTDDSGKPSFKSYRVRLIRKGTVWWRGAIHEDVQRAGTEEVIEEILTYHRRSPVRAAGNKDRNLTMLEKIVNEGDAEPRHLFYFARELMYHDRLDEAIEFFDRYLKVAWWAPEIYRAHIDKAIVYISKGDYLNAKKSCFDAIVLNPHYIDAYYHLGDIAYAEKDWRTCILWMEAVIIVAANPSPIFDDLAKRTYKPYHYLSVAYSKAGDMSRARSNALKCVELKPGDPTFTSNLEWFDKRIRETIPMREV